VRSFFFNGRDHIDPLQDHAEYSVRPVEPLRLDGIYEPLRSVRVGFPSSVGDHAQQVFSVVLYGKGFALEIVSLEDAFSSGSIAVGIVATLNHKVGYDTMDDRIFVAHVLSRYGSFSTITLAQGREIFDRLWSDLSEQTKHDAPEEFAVLENFQEHTLGNHGQCWYGVHFRWDCLFCRGFICTPNGNGTQEL